MRSRDIPTRSHKIVAFALADLAVDIALRATPTDDCLAITASLDGAWIHSGMPSSTNGLRVLLVRLLHRAIAGDTCSTVRTLSEIRAEIHRLNSIGKPLPLTSRLFDE